MKIFEANCVSKWFDKTQILKDISFSINRGDRIAITGHNGSGKSSLLKLIGGIYGPNSGRVSKKSLKIGYVPEHFPEKIRFSLMEYLVLLGKISGKRDEVLAENITNYVEHFSIKDFLHTPLKNCSKGTKQKAGIIQALLLEPELLLLDEPMTGLDEDAQNELLKQLNSLSNEMTIIFTVHDSLLIDGLSNRVITMESGRIIEDRLVDSEIKEHRVITASLKNTVLQEFPSLSIIQLSDSIVEIEVPTNQSDQVLMLLLKNGSSVLGLREKR